MRQVVQSVGWVGMRLSLRGGAVLALAAMAVAAMATGAMALGEEDFGNTPLNEANFKDWPGVMPVVNHPSRVYHSWVNGNENCYYQGDLAALNDTLRKLSGVNTEQREVVLRPGPGVIHSFSGEKTIPFGWNLNLIGGIAKHQTTLPEGAKVWSKHPRLTVYVPREMDLGKLDLPKSLTVIPIATLKGNITDGLKSTDTSVRGWGCGILAHLDPFDPQSRDAIAAMLDDKDDWVKLNAAGSLTLFGKSASPVLPRLRQLMDSKNEQLRKRAGETVEAIEKAEDRAADEKDHRLLMERIEARLKAR